MSGSGNVPFHTVVVSSEAFLELVDVLPASTTMSESDDPDTQARAALGLLIETARPFSKRDEQPIPPDPSTCPNCGIPTSSSRSPFCGSCCREEAGFVRQVRRAIAERTIFDEEKQATLGQNLWRLLGGGFPRRQLLVNDKERARLFKRNNGMCEVCGKSPATTFDHVGSG